MHKNQFLSKLNKIDFNNQLEEVLEKKSFTADAKNMLLNMLYKIEIGYNDFAKVKRVVPDKNDFIKEIIETIRNNSKNIKLVEPSSELGKKLICEKQISSVIADEIIALPTEYAVLTAITKEMTYKYKSNNILSDEIQNILKKGHILSSQEVIYNFDGWTWNIGNLPNDDLIYLLLYNNLLFLIGLENLEEWRKDKYDIDYIKVIKDTIFNIYSGENQAILFNELKILLANGLVESFPNIANEYITKLKELKSELDLLEDTSKYLNEISKKQKTYNSKIKSIDTKLSNRDLLEKEYEQENEIRPLEKKIFSVRHYAELLKKEREEYIEKIYECNRLIEPASYVEKKDRLKDEIKKYEIIENALQDKKNFEQSVINFQKVFLKLLEERIDKINNKKELIDLIYILRYYKNIKIGEKYVKDISSIKKEIEIFERTLLLKAYNGEIFNKLTENTIYTVDILIKILDTQIIDLEGIVILPRIEDNIIILDIYDGEVIDSSIKLSSDIKVILLKQNKKHKLFN